MHSGMVFLKVIDSGPGFDSTAAERLFEPLYSTKQSGMGMGLAICKSIIESHGGKLTASVAKPHGAAFHIALPEIEDR